MFCLQESDVSITTDTTTVTVGNGTKQCSAANEGVSIKHSQPNSTTVESPYADLEPRPVDAPKILPELEKVEYNQMRKQTVEYAELGAKPAISPVFLPPDPCVQHVDVEPTPKAKVSVNLFIMLKGLYRYM